MAIPALQDVRVGLQTIANLWLGRLAPQATTQPGAALSRQHLDETRAAAVVVMLTLALPPLVIYLLAHASIELGGALWLLMLALFLALVALMVLPPRRIVNATPSAGTRWTAAMLPMWVAMMLAMTIALAVRGLLGPEYYERSGNPVPLSLTASFPLAAPMYSLGLLLMVRARDRGQPLRTQPLLALLVVGWVLAVVAGGLHPVLGAGSTVREWWTHLRFAIHGVSVLLPALVMHVISRGAAERRV